MQIPVLSKCFLVKVGLTALPNAQQGGWPWWAWLLLILVVILILVLLWWFFWRPKKKEELPAAAKRPTPVEMPVEVETPAPPTPVTPDDLTIIEGIGPKIASILNAAGYTTFQQLVGTDVIHLNKILQDAGLRLADPSSWIDQAKLAAEGKWDELKVLQDSLKGGRRV